MLLRVSKGNYDLLLWAITHFCLVSYENLNFIQLQATRQFWHWWDAQSPMQAVLRAAKCYIYYFLLSVRPAVLLVTAWELRELPASRLSWSILSLSLQVQPFLQFLRSCTRQVSCGFPHPCGAPTFQDLQVVPVPYAVLHICPWGYPSWRTSWNAQLAFTQGQRLNLGTELQWTQLISGAGDNTFLAFGITLRNAYHKLVIISIRPNSDLSLSWLISYICPRWTQNAPSLKRNASCLPVFRPQPLAQANNPWALLDWHMVSTEKSLKWKVWMLSSTP